MLYIKIFARLSFQFVLITLRHYDKPSKQASLFILAYVCSSLMHVLNYLNSVLLCTELAASTD